MPPRSKPSHHLEATSILRDALEQEARGLRCASATSRSSPWNLIISQNQFWGRHRSEVEDEPDASLEDLEWADGVGFGSPMRLGNVAGQLKRFMDQAGRLWQEGKLADKVATAFTAPVRHLIHEREEGRGSQREDARGRPLPGPTSRPPRGSRRRRARGGCLPRQAAKARALPRGHARLSPRRGRRRAPGPRTPPSS
jgi:NADPH-dependent FMN reductase